MPFPIVFLPGVTSDIVTFDMTPRLRSAELLDLDSATAEAVEWDGYADPSLLTVESPQVNTISDDDLRIAVQKAIQFRVKPSEEKSALFLVKVQATVAGRLTPLEDFIEVKFEYPSRGC